MGLLDLERRRLPGEYDLDLDLDLERERLLEERDRLRLLWGQWDNGGLVGAVYMGFSIPPHAYLDLEREEERERERDREREEEREDFEERELERDDERPRLLDLLRDLEGPLQEKCHSEDGQLGHHTPRGWPHDTHPDHLFLFSWPLRRLARILARKNS